MRHWEMMYQRPPISTDALLFAAALLLHMPLLMLQMKAPPKMGAGKGRLISVDIIERINQQSALRVAAPAPLPPKLPVVSRPLPKPPVALPPVVVPPRPKMPTMAVPPPANPTILPKPSATPLPPPSLSSKTPFVGNAPLRGPTGSAPGLKNAGGAAIAVSPRSSLGGDIPGPALKGRSGFAVAPRTLSSGIGGGDGTIKAGEPAVLLPVGKYAVSDTSALSRAPVARSGGGVGGTVPSPSVGGGRAYVAPPTTGAPTASIGNAPRHSPAVPNPIRRPAAQRPMFTITGPLKDRKVLSQVVPEYPEWARSQGVEDLVVLQFTVTPEGRVKENIQSLRASAYPELDALAKEALLQWVFVPLPDGQWRDEVGTITMSFSVR